MVRLLISTGEVSGDLQGSLLIEALHRQASLRGLDLEVLALGGSRMQAAGAELLAGTSPTGGRAGMSIFPSGSRGCSGPAQWPAAPTGPQRRV